MASPAAAIQPRIAARRVRLLLNSGGLLISAGGMVIVHTAARAPSSCALIAFLIFLLGVSLVTLALAVTAQQQLEGNVLPSGTANPAAAIAAAAGLLRRASALATAKCANLLRAARHVRLIRPELIAGAAALLVSTAASFIVGAAANTSAVDGPRALFLAAFVLFILGVWLALLALVIMDRDPEPEIGSVTIA